jgi:general secretion pathway protein A
VPRLINIIADRALAAAYARETGRVNARLVHAAASEVQPSEHRVRSNPWRGLAATAAALLLVVVTLMTWGPAWLDRFDYAPSPEVAADEPAAAGGIPTTGPVGDPAAPAAAQPDSVPAPALGTAADVTETLVSDPGPTLDGSWLAEQHRAAWRSLADLWQSPGKALAIQSACDGVPATGFACLRESGSWARIRELGLPVLLVLRDGETQLVPLMGFTGQYVVVGAPADQRVVARSEIEESWWGDYLVAWPQAPDWPLDIRRGESGPAVDIVMQMASFATPPWNGEGAFDAAFEAWLLDFQRQRGLAPDGIIGPNTLLYLMAPTITEPRLALDRAEEG